MNNKGMSTALLLAACFLAASVHSACLDTTTLNSLGFDKTQVVGTIAAPTVCKDIFATSGTCVPEATVKAKIKADTADLAEAISVSSVSVSVLETLQTSDGLTSAQKNGLKTIVSNMQSTQQKCLTAWNLIQQGVTCFLASGAASTNTRVNTQVFVDVDTDKVGAVLEDCLSWIDGICLLTTGVSFATGITLTDSSFQSEIDTYGAACNSLATYKNCAATDATCLTNRRTVLVNAIFQPYNYNFFPDPNRVDSIKTTLEKQLNNIKDWFNGFFSRRLVEEESTRTNAKSGGQDVATNGQNSGVATGTINSVAKLLVSVIALLAFIVM